jgi:hypothetical protein
MITSTRTLLRQKDDLYEIIRDFSVEYFYGDDKLIKRDLFDDWKEFLSADIVLKKDSRFFFCKRVEELEFEMVSTEIVPAIEA